MMQYKIPIIILVLLILTGAGFSLYRGSRVDSPALNYPSNQTSDQSASDFINSLIQNGENQADDKTPWTVTVSKVVDATFSLVQPNNGQASTPTLTYSMLGPDLTLNSSRSGSANVMIEVYDDSNDLVTSNNSTMYLQKGNQVVKIPFSVQVKKPGKYSVNFRMLNSGSILYEKNFSNLLVGTTGTPVIQKVGLSTYGVIHDNRYGDMENIGFDIKATNLGNSDVLGYYKLQATVNGELSSVGAEKLPFMYITDTEDLRSDVPSFGYTNSGDIYLSTTSPLNTHTSNFKDEYVDILVPCKKGDKVGLNVSFIQVNQTSSLEGTPIGSTSIDIICAGKK